MAFVTETNVKWWCEAPAGEELGEASCLGHRTQGVNGTDHDFCFVF